MRGKTVELGVSGLQLIPVQLCPGPLISAENGNHISVCLTAGLSKDMNQMLVVIVIITTVDFYGLFKSRTS